MVRGARLAASTQCDPDPDLEAERRGMSFAGLELTEDLGPIPYGHVYTHLPILALGGSGDPAACGTGRLDVYLSIVSQTF